MTELLHQRLRENVQKLISVKGNVGCPAAHLNKNGGEQAVSCLHICGAIFPRWKNTTYFKKGGAKNATNNCPCSSPLTLIIDKKWVCVKDVFWAYIDEVLERKPKQEQDMSPNW